MPETTGSRFERAVSIMARLRAPGGCPWDREQTFDSIKPYTLEEAYEVLEAIDSRDWGELPGELGDLLLQVLFYSEMATEQGTFSIDDVLDRLSKKLVDRHPHVFGDVQAETSSEVLRNWEAIKAQERARRKNNSDAPAQSVNSNIFGEVSPVNNSALAGVSSAMPALMEARKLSSRAAHVGFDWSGMDGLWEKLQEEIKELQNETAKITPGTESSVGAAVAPNQIQISQELHKQIEGELGDLFFVLVNIARHLSVDPELALKSTNRKFRRRFQWMEQQLQASGRKPEDAGMEELESLWQQAKIKE